MAIKKWVIGKSDREAAKLLAQECDVDPFVALVAVARGINTSAELDQYLSRECSLCDPRELADITVAADIINAAIENNEKIAVYGDYDCDGIASTALMYDYLTSRGADCVTYIPDRLGEGYGMNTAAIDKLNGMGVGVIITVDNGISSYDEVEYANALGMTVVITDHHIPPATLPRAAAVVDPKRSDCVSSFKEICGAQVAFKLCCVIDDKEPEQMIAKYADLLCVAIIGDVMPLVSENRDMVREGINKIRRNPSVGISAILNAAGVDRKQITSGKISYAITPRINAAGRMGSATRALDLVLCKDMLKALGMAGEIDTDNSRRQAVERDICEQAINIIEQKGYNNDRVIVVEGKDWHLGVIGIVASRICEKYSKPAIVLSNQGENMHGSGRSHDKFNLFEAIFAAKDCLIRYGGHDQAAGVTLASSRVEEFRRKINDYAATLPYSVPEIKIDFKLNPAAMSVDMAHAVKLLEPFGNCNPVPVFALIGVTLQRINELSGGKHLKLFFSKDDCRFEALLFNTTKDKFCFATGDTLDLAVTLEANYFREQYNLSVLIRAVRVSGVDEERAFFEKEKVEDFLRGENADSAVLLPSREEIGAIYKEIKAAPVLAKRLIFTNIKTVGYAKTRVAVMILKEIGVITENGGFLTAVENAGKTELSASVTYTSLRKGEYDL